MNRDQRRAFIRLVQTLDQSVQVAAACRYVYSHSTKSIADVNYRLANDLWILQQDIAKGRKWKIRRNACKHCGHFYGHVPTCIKSTPIFQ